MTTKPITGNPEVADPQLRPRYTGIATFFRTPLCDSAAAVDIAVVGVPFDGGVTHRTGARHGPRAVREQTTMIRKFNPATGVAPFELANVADLGDAWLERPYELEGALREIEAFFRAIHLEGATPLSIGGDHSVSLPILRAIARDRPIGLVHVDAHCDTGDDYLGSRFHHGAPFRRAVEEGLVDPKRVIQIGIRGSLNQPDMWAFSHESGMRVVSIEEFDDRGWRWAAEEALRVVGAGAAYLSFDVDSARSRLCARNRDPGSRRAYDARGAAPRASVGSARSRRRRRRRGFAAVRPVRRHRAQRRDDRLRGPVRADVRSKAALSAIRSSETGAARLKPEVAASRDQLCPFHGTSQRSRAASRTRRRRRRRR